ncbi:ferrichrome porin FhuA [Erwinia sp. OLTSP20]|uniref:ferrichrome porin FhuA n=1 Tax=unclassified Erwinia TaxID=2622719 RepID=UPI000C179FF3|nr:MULTISPECIES: ferrichrome porin FhuA [unclassified Erwinia]PIJ49801.1 ferrichrome porin FhuA [Erwinia sp. OAMSP11]PIJ70901.1 ferrichrome porin FhuA [Erwinia sp. OLSSP12]PIJ80266.1 ferrichrome porin FhuA [Erwinia sp. OLCASP19]PIJ82390.1 ferrichrome porin FhuA [Erwinia sp. OLMTSP26]PIJ85076.1 ferrichrome porin FhuA [Erwinia sp. OLMDSP33]
MAKWHTQTPCFTPNTAKKPLTFLIALATGSLVLSGQTSAAEQTMTVQATANDAAAENAWGPAATIAAKRTATATKTDTPIEKTPQSVSVVTRQEMELHNINTVKDAFNYTPGVASNRGSSDVIDALSIRGFNDINTNQYLDGLKLQSDNYSEFAIDPYFLERAEVLRGPASVLYGKSNPGGVVSLVSKRPTLETLREVRFQMGTDNLFSTGFDFGGALDDNGEFSYRLTGLARDAEAQQKANKEKRYTIAPSFSWRPDENTTFTFLSYFQNEPETGYYGWLPREGTVVPFVDANGNQHKLSTDFDDGDGNKISRNTKMVGYNFEHNFNDTWTVRQNLRYADLKTDYFTIYGNGFNAATSEILRGYAKSQEELNEFAVDTQAQARFSTAALDHTLLMGVDYQRTRNDINAIFGTATPLSAIDPHYGNNQMVGSGFPYRYLNKQEQTGLYTQDQMEWNRWVLTLGGRYDYAMTSALNRTSESETKNHDQAFTWRGGLNYVFDNGIAPYFSYSESFIPTPGTTAAGQPFDPSRAKQYEAGVKYVPKDRPIVITGALFQLTKDKNLTTDPANSGFNVQSGEIRSRGIELEAKAALTANVNMVASYTYTDAVYTHDTKYQDRTPVQVPKHMASLWTDYTFHETALSGLTFGAGVRYVGESQGLYQFQSGAEQNQNFAVAGYTTVDALVKYDLGRFGLPGSSIGVNVNNLLNREYVASCYHEYDCYWGHDRQIIGTATFRF